MDAYLDGDWELHPINGNTGTAYMGVKKDEKVFLKKNTSPFLVALSLADITPKLVWTKRMGNGDIMTAQEWLNGHTLSREEMYSPSVISLLKKFHRSASLKKMLRRVGGQAMDAETILKNYQQNITSDLAEHDLIAEVLVFLQANLSAVSIPNQVSCVCHGDLNHKNWLMSDCNNLYLVDWDAAMIADPAIDVATLFAHYIPTDNWQDWLRVYGDDSEDFLRRIRWYIQMDLLNQIQFTHGEHRFHEMNQYLMQLQSCACSL